MVKPLSCLVCNMSCLDINYMAIMSQYIAIKLHKVFLFKVMSRKAC